MELNGRGNSGNYLSTGISGVHKVRRCFILFKVVFNVIVILFFPLGLVAGSVYLVKGTSLFIGLMYPINHF